MDIIWLARILYAIQLAHSVEEIATGFPEKWFYRWFSARSFLIFEILHNIFWGIAVFAPGVPQRIFLPALFSLLMFANGIEHIVWYMKEKKYVPGLITAPFHVAAFAFYFLSGL